MIPLYNPLLRIDSSQWFAERTVDFRPIEIRPGDMCKKSHTAMHIPAHYRYYEQSGRLAVKPVN